MHRISHTAFSHVHSVFGRCRSARLRAAATALIFLLWAARAGADPSCSDEWVCIEPVEDSDQVVFLARNLKPWPITVTFRARTTNLKGPSRSQTLSLAGGEAQPIASYQRRRTGKRYSYRYWYDWTVGVPDPQHDADYPYTLPYQTGRDWRVLQGFGSRFSHTGREHYAVDFDMPVGSQVHAARGGTVVRVTEHHNKGCWQDGCGRYANFIVVLHDDLTTGEYYHLKKNGALVSSGDRIEAGQHIGYSGNTGHTTTPHLHFAVYKADTWGRTQSLPFRFSNGQQRKPFRPRAGSRYRRQLSPDQGNN